VTALSAMAYWLVAWGTAEDPMVPPRDDWRARRARWSALHGDVHMFPRRPRITPGDVLVAYAVGSAQAFGEGRVFALHEALAEAQPSRHERWRWQVPVRLLRGVSYLGHAPTLRDIGVSSRSVRQQSHIRLSDEQGRRAADLIDAARAGG
jgi:hypothetical protein